MKNLPPSLRFLEANAWALQPRIFEALADIVERHAAGVRLDADHVKAAIGDVAADAEPREPEMKIVGSTAIISMRGVVARYADQVNGICQPSGRSADALLADLEAAAANPAVRQVVLRIDSPGGTVAGTSEVADAVRAVSAGGKPVHAFVDGLAASAAYWIASQADEIVAAAPTTAVGSIGVLAALVERAPSKDAKVHVVRSAPLKAPGAMGTAIDEKQLASIQQHVNDLAGAFATAVAGGRGLTNPQQAAATTGEIFAAGRALEMGLIDGVEAWSAFLARVARGAPLASTDAEGTPLRVAGLINPTAAGTSPAASTAGTSPAPTPDTPAGTDTMKITAAVLAALIASAVDEAALISAMATGDPAKGLLPASEDEIRAAINTAQRKKLADRITALEGEATAAATAHKAAIAAKDGELASLKGQLAKSEKVVAIARGAAADPGADHTGADAPTDASLKAEWAGMTKAKRAGFFNDFDVFKHEQTADKSAEHSAGKEA